MASLKRVYISIKRNGCVKDVNRPEGDEKQSPWPQMNFVLHKQKRLIKGKCSGTARPGFARGAGLHRNREKCVSGGPKWLKVGRKRRAGMSSEEFYLRHNKKTKSAG